MYRSFLALRYLRSRLVNFIAVGGVMFGVAVLIVVTSVMDGFRAKVLTVVRGNLSDLVLSPLHPPGEPLPDYAALDRELRKDPRICATAPQVETLVFYLYPSRSRSQLSVDDHAIFQMRAIGIDWDREKEVSRIAEYLKAANDRARPFFSQRRIDYVKEGTVMISRTFAEKFRGLGTLFDLPQSLLEQDVGLTFANLQGAGAAAEEGGGGQAQASWSTYQLPVSAVFDAEDTSMEVGRVYMDRDTLRRISRIEDAYHQIRVKLDDPAQARQVQADLLQRFPDFEVMTWEDQRADFLRAVNNEKVLLAIVLSFIVLLGGFIILATLTLTVVEKTRDIGVLAALGATRPGIRSLFVGNGFLIGVLGSILGVLLGWLFTSNVNGIKDWLASYGIQIFPPDIYLFREIPTIWSWETVAWIVGGSLLVAFVAGFIPAWRASRMDPVRALRYE